MPKPRRSLKLLLLLLSLVLVGMTPTFAFGQARPAVTTPQFKVLAFYSGTFDAAHISFEKEANAWFPQVAAANNFSYTSTTNWDMLNTLSASQFQVIMFLDDAPQTAAQRAGFQHYMQNGGAWFGFHVTAFNTDPSTWDWYYNQLLGTGAFVSNTWDPTIATLKVESQHPATRRLGSTFVSAVSEWYSWTNDLRQNPNIQILASVDPSGFPLGTDPNQSWTSGYFPILWTNKNFKMLYANFGHNWMNYNTNTPLSTTFGSPAEDAFVIDGLLWLGGGAPSNAPTNPIPPANWYSLVNTANGKCVDARGAGTANGTAIQQFTCNGSTAQGFQFAQTTGPYLRINNRNNPNLGFDVTNVSTADNAPIQLWTYNGGLNQQWQAVPEGNGVYHIVNRNGGADTGSKCLTVPNSSTADSTQLVQLACTGVSSQSFRLVQQP
jgi:Trehalose utilisation/Ricin-type beta-trefoil lectin domain